MRKVFKIIVSSVLTITLLLEATSPLYAQEEMKEESVDEVTQQSEQISQDMIDIGNSNIVLSQDSFEYTSQPQVPIVYVYYEDKLLEEGTDYDLAFSNDCIMPGNILITVTGKGMYFGTNETSYTILEKEIQAISLGTEELIVLNGSRYVFDSSIEPSDTSQEKKLEWFSSNENVASIENGVLSAHSVGTTIIQAKTVNGKETNCMIHVIDDTSNVSSVANHINGVKIHWQFTQSYGYTIYKKNDGGKWQELSNDSLLNLDDTTVVDTNVDSGKKYYYSISFMTDTGNTKYNQTGQSILYLAKPRINSISAVPEGMKIKYTSIPGALSYLVYKVDETGKKIYVGTSSTTSFVDTKAVSDGNQYNYCIRAKATRTYSLFSDVYESSRLATPVLLKVANGRNGIEVNWQEVEGAYSYTVLRKVYGSSTYKVVKTGISTNVYEDTNVESGVIYVYSIKANLENGCSSYYDVNGIRRKYVAMPKNISATNLIAGTQLKWNKVEGATKYIVYSVDSNGTSCKLATTTKNTYLDTNAQITGNSYVYKIKAYNESTSSKTSDLIELTRVNTPSLLKTYNIDNKIVLNWSSVERASGYKVYRKTNDDYQEIADILDSCEFEDTNTMEGEVYTYTVRAYFIKDGNITYSSKYSRGLQGVILGSTTVVLVSVTNGAKLHWDEVSGATTYNIYRRQLDEEYSLIGSTTSLTYTDKSPIMEQQYYYTVEAVNGDCRGSYGDSEVEATLYLGNVTMKEAYVSGSKIIVKWNKADNAKYYRIYRKTSSGNWKLIESSNISTTYKDVSAFLNTTYYYKVLAVNGDFISSTCTTNGVKAKISGTKKYTIKYLSQRDSRWEAKRYGEWTMEESGCYQTVYAMALNALSGTNYLPTDVANWVYNHTDYFNKDHLGTKGSCIKSISNHYGVKFKCLKSLADINSALSKGWIVVGAVGPGKFTIEGFTHAILLNGYSNGYTYAYDPYKSTKNGKIATGTIWTERAMEPLDYYDGACFFAIYL